MKPLSALALLPVVGILAVWLLLLRPTALGGPMGYVMVSGHSMQPTYYTGDLVLTRREAHYRIGDIIAYHIPRGQPGIGGIIIHRIVGGNGTAGFEMRGDNNNFMDPWRPRTSDIVGKAWVHVPGGARWFQWLRQPLNAGVIIGGISVFSLLSGRRLKRRRKRGAHMSGHERHSTDLGTGPSARLSAPWWVLLVLGGFGILAILFGVYTFRALRSPTAKSVYVERFHYAQQATLNYTVHTTPSLLYPDGVIGPVASVLGPDGKPAKVTPPPIYTRLAKTIDIDFKYVLTGSQPPQVAGEVSADLQVRADNGWTKTMPLQGPVPFEGPNAAARFTVDLNRVRSLIDAIEKQTGVSAQSYNLVLTPTVHLRGKIGSNPVDEEYAPDFTFKYTRSRITAPTDLIQAQPTSIGGDVSQTEHMPLLLLPLTIREARGVGAALTLLSLGLASAMAAVVFLGVGQDETTKARLRYGTTLVSVREATHNGSAVVQVASMQDLARLAARDGHIIFRQPVPDGDLYFVPDGAVTYEYVALRDEGA